MDRNQTLLYMIADLYRENKQLEDEVKFLKKDNADYRNDTEIAEKDVKELKETVALLRERLRIIHDNLEYWFRNGEPIKSEEIGKLLLYFGTQKTDKRGLSNDNKSIEMCTGRNEKNLFL